MTSIFEKTYSSKSTALRGAQRAKLEEGTYVVEQNADGRWFIQEIEIEIDVGDGDEIDIYENNDKVREMAARIASEKGYKQIAFLRMSAFRGVVAFIHAFLDANPDLTRKQAMVALIEGYQVAFYTARTQYQKWHAKRKVAAFTAALDDTPAPKANGKGKKAK